MEMEVRGGQRQESEIIEIMSGCWKWDRCRWQVYGSINANMSA